MTMRAFKTIFKKTEWKVEQPDGWAKILEPGEKEEELKKIDYREDAVIESDGNRITVKLPLTDGNNLAIAIDWIKWAKDKQNAARLKVAGLLDAWAFGDSRTVEKYIRHLLKENYAPEDELWQGKLYVDLGRAIDSEVEGAEIVAEKGEKMLGINPSAWDVQTVNVGEGYIKLVPIGKELGDKFMSKLPRISRRETFDGDRARYIIFKTVDPHIVNGELIAPKNSCVCTETTQDYIDELAKKVHDLMDFAPLQYISISHKDDWEKNVWGTVDAYNLGAFGVWKKVGEDICFNPYVRIREDELKQADALLRFDEMPALEKRTPVSVWLMENAIEIHSPFSDDDLPLIAAVFLGVYFQFSVVIENGEIKIGEKDDSPSPVVEDLYRLVERN